MPRDGKSKGKEIRNPVPWGRVQERTRAGKTKFYASEPIGNHKYQPSPENPFTSHSAAAKWLRNRETDVGKLAIKPNADNSNMTFGDWHKRFKRGKEVRFEKGHLSPSQIDDYRSIGRLYIEPMVIEMPDGKKLRLYDIPMRKFDPSIDGIQIVEAIQKACANLKGQRGYHPKRQAQKTENQCAMVCKFAMDKGGVGDNPFSHEEIVRNNEVFHRDAMTLTEDLVDELADSVPLSYRAAIYLWAYVGLRANEAWGLKVGDLDLDGEALYLRRSLRVCADRDITDRTKRVRTGVMIGPRKPKRQAEFFLHDFVIEELREHLERRNAGPNDWLFVDHNKPHLPVNHKDFIRYVFNESKTDGMEGVVVHSLRHFCGSWHLFVLDYSRALVQSMLDHSDGEMTRLYGHPMRSVAKEFSHRASTRYAGRKERRLKVVKDAS